MEAHEGASGEDPDDAAKTIAPEIFQGSRERAVRSVIQRRYWIFHSRHDQPILPVQLLVLK